jgi:co-chaperonin GroES (HSP10)
MSRIYNVAKVHLHHDLVLVQRIDAAKTPSGLVIPYHPDRKESNLARIIEVGPGLPNKPELRPQCKIGEYWLIARYIGTVFSLGDKEVTIVKWADCQARVEFEPGAEKLLEEAAIKSDSMGEA